MTAVHLSSGETEYELIGPEAGPLVVLLHGGSIPMWTWDRQVPTLIKAGCRVLRYDMYGKGKSSCRPLDYDRELFRIQLSDLLTALGLSEPVHLVGFSFGGATAANFTAHHPERVRSLALISPVFHFAEGSSMVRIARIPAVGNLFLHFILMKKAEDRASRLWAGVDDADHYAKLFRAQISQPGFERGLLSFFRSDALDDYSSVYKKIGREDRKTLLVWGNNDEDIPSSHITRIRSLMPFAEYHELPGIGHGAVFQSSNVVNNLLLNHLGPS